jgi:regulator of sigma E protease
VNSFFAFIIVLGILIFVHEFGHFIVARIFGVGVEKFSLGFGPRLFGFKRNNTDYFVSAIPLGGYVKMVGEDPGDSQSLSEAEKAVSFTHKPVLQRMMIVAAGPVFNLLLAVVIFFALFFISGEFVLKPTVGKVDPTSPAGVAGLAVGDQIVAIDGEALESWQAMAERIAQSQGRELAITVLRNEQRLELRVTPERRDDVNLFGEPIERYVIGVTSSGDFFNRKLGPLAALTRSVGQSWEFVKLTVLSVVKIIRGTISHKNIGGPLMIAEMAGQQAKEGLANLVSFIALLSINLAILNFLPIPVLDGGHLMFFTIEAILGRPVNLRAREILQQVGVFILIMLMVLIFYNDISSLYFN